MLEPLTHNEFTIKDSFNFAKEITTYDSSLYMGRHVYMRPEVNSNRFEISNRFEKSFRLHGDFTAATCK